MDAPTLTVAANYLLWILGAAAVCGITVNIPRIVKSYKKEHYPNGTPKEQEKDRQKSEAFAKYNRFNQQKQLERDHVVTEVTNVEFRNDQGEVSVRKFAEIISFDEEKDKVYKGRLGYYTPNGAFQDRGVIYLFQPRLSYCTGKTPEGESIMKEILPNDFKGVLDQRNTYVYQLKGDSNNKFVGYTPKREVVTGKRYDYVLGEYRYCIDGTSDSEQITSDYKESQIRSILQIKMNTDEHGNLIPVDLNSPDERKEFDSYVKSHRKDANDISYDVYLSEIISKVTRYVENGFDRLVHGQDLTAEEYGLVDPVEQPRKQERKQSGSGDAYTDMLAEGATQANRMEMVGGLVDPSQMHGPIPVIAGRRPSVQTNSSGDAYTDQLAASATYANRMEIMGGLVDPSQMNRPMPPRHR